MTRGNHSVICYVGIDTSNYTTSAAVCDTSGRVLANIKIPLSVRDGESGLRQSDAVFAHTKNIPELMARLRRALDGYTPAAVGCSAYPRDVSGSYMPCFLVGIAAAEAFGTGSDIPIYHFSHQAGHVMAAAYSSGEAERLLSAPFCAFHVSGGTTEILYVEPNENRFNIKLVGGTLDLNAGQAIDRAGVAMGLNFPCGPELERLAQGYKGKLPSIKVSVKGLHCNLSGLENRAAAVFAESGDKAKTAAYVIRYVGLTLLKLSENLRYDYPDIPILYAGGVMSNSIIKSMLSDDNVFFAEPEFSADNAAGTALLCRRYALAEKDKGNG